MAQYFFNGVQADTLAQLAAAPAGMHTYTTADHSQNTTAQFLEAFYLDPSVQILDKVFVADVAPVTHSVTGSHTPDGSGGFDVSETISTGNESRYTGFIVFIKR